MTTNTEDGLLVSMGFNLYWNTVIYVIGAVMYGLYLAIFAVCLGMILTRPRKSRASKALLVAILLLFVATTAYFIIQTIGLLGLIDVYLREPHIPLPDRFEQYKLQFSVMALLSGWPMINWIISDLIVLWHTWVLYPGNTAVRVSVGIFAAANTALWISQNTLTDVDILKNTLLPEVEGQMSLASRCMSLGTNALGTAFIAWKAWRHYRMMKGIPTRLTDVTRILIILVESGLIFVVIQLLMAILNSLQGNLDGANTPPVTLASMAITNASIYLGAILPTLTVIIVWSNKSLQATISSEIESRPSSSRPIAPPISTIRFADNLSAAESGGSVMDDSDSYLDYAEQNHGQLEIYDIEAGQKLEGKHSIIS
ncbi:hypothetical protein BT96DRAFT_928572 [Gymnopus androsaceus JB14]|uniref:Uncharacterized protein n=1 Tax=Gymnopus androsaceus JB14 TaxID=1447944 RepID=A0A6A4GKX8_9AGAR|nr:hypothetical protein BT96DRAFT_928572 [Gymnopus androsaceus JB14]